MLSKKPSRSFLVEDMDSLLHLAQSETDEGSTNKRLLKGLLAATRHAIAHELTKRQYECLTMRYEQGMKLSEIAKELGISSSAVARHIYTAQQKVQKYASYCVFAYSESPAAYSGQPPKKAI